MLQCEQDAADRPPEDSAIAAESTDARQAPLSHASGFSVRYFPDHREIIVSNPWQGGSIYHRYLLYPRGAKLPIISDAAVSVVETPLKSLMVLSTTHIGMLLKLGLQEHLSGVAQQTFVYDAGIRQRLDDGAIAEVGAPENINIELVLNRQPDMIMLSGYDKIDENISRLQRSGILPCYNIEWMENTPLGRAEWLKFIGHFFNRQDTAAVIFAGIAERYRSLKDSAAQIIRKGTRAPTVFTGNSFKGTWYVPGGKNYGTRFLVDAGARYYWSSDSSRGSLPLSFETVLASQLNSDIWLQPGSITSLDEIRRSDSRYTRFQAFQKGRVYNNDARMTAGGGNDYWESGPANPDVVLADLLKILYPKHFPGHQLYYYRRLH